MWLATLNVTSDLQSWGARGVFSVPSLVLFREGNEVPQVYTGRRSTAFVHTWLLRTEGVRLKYVPSLSALEALTEVPVLVYGFFPSAETDVLQTFRALVPLFTDVVFAYSSEPEMSLNLSPNSVAVLRPSSWEVGSVTSSMQIEPLRSFVRLHTFPRVLDLANAEGGSGGFGGSILDVLEFPGPVLILVGLEIPHWSVRDLGFLLVTIPCGEMKSFTEWLGSSECDKAWMYVNGTKYLSTDSLIDFVQTYQDKVPFRKGKPLEGFPRLVLFYTTWCAACLNVLDEYDAIDATHLGIKVSKLNLAENYIDGQKFFPAVSLYFSETDFVPYEGKIEKEKLLSWLTTQAVSRAPIHDEL